MSADNSNGATAAVLGTVLAAVFQNIDQALTRTLSSSDQSYWQRECHDDHWVNGGVHWDGYDLLALIKMVAAPASPVQVDTVAEAWRMNGAAITQSAENLSQSLSTLMKYWQGPAAQQASTSVTNSTAWITALGDTTTKMANTVEDAGGALRAAQSTMPGQPTIPLWAGFGTATDGAAAGSTGGPFGAAAGTMMGGLTSVFAVSSDQAALKQQAVQTMQRYEQAAISIDTSTPRFTVPPTWSTTGSTSTTGVGMPGAPTVTGPSIMSGGTGPTTLPSFADNPTGRWNALTGGGGGQSGAGGGQPGGFAGMFGVGGLAGNVTDAERRAAAGAGSASGASAAVAAKDDSAATSGKAGSGSVLESVDQARGGAVGAPMGGGMMGGGLGASGAANSEHQRRVAPEENPFLTGMTVAPRVIGASALDQESGDK